MSGLGPSLANGLDVFLPESIKRVRPDITDLLNSLHDLDDEIDALKFRIEELEEENEELKDRLK